MLLSITNRSPDATDLGHLLHKHPARCHDVELAFGKGVVFYPVASADECTAVLMVDVDPVGLVRSEGACNGGWTLGQYVNDRPYAASSFLSVAISRAFGTALNGRCRGSSNRWATKSKATACRLSRLFPRGAKADTTS